MRPFVRDTPMSRQFFETGKGGMTKRCRYIIGQLVPLPFHPTLQLFSLLEEVLAPCTLVRLIVAWFLPVLSCYHKLLL